MLKKFSGIVLSILLICLFAVNSSAESEHKISFGIGLDNNSVQYKSAIFFKDLVEKNSAGKIAVEVYHSGQIGSDIEMMEALKMGFQEMTWPASAPVSTFVKEFQIIDLPFLFPTLEAADYVLDSSFGQKLLGKLSDVGIIGLAYGEIGTRHLTNSKRPIKNLDDLKGLRIRNMQNQVHLETWRQLGANPGPLAFGELFSALQQGVFDGMEMPWDIVYDMKFYEVQKYGTDIGWVYSPSVLLLSKKFYDKLPKNLQTVIREAALKTQFHNRKLRRSSEKEKVDELSKKMEITFLTPKQRAKFIEAAKPVHQKYKDKLGAELFNDLMSKINESNK